MERLTTMNYITRRTMLGAIFGGAVAAMGLARATGRIEPREKLRIVSARLIIETTRNKERSGDSFRSAWRGFARTRKRWTSSSANAERSAKETSFTSESEVECSVPVALMDTSSNMVPGPVAFRPGKYRLYTVLEGRHIDWGGEVTIELTLSDGTTRIASTGRFKFEDNVVVAGSHPPGNTGTASGDTVWQK